MSLFGGDDSGGPTRKTHIKRIYKNDDPDTGLWVDIERIDELTYTSGTGFAQQTKVWTFDWSGFDPNGEGVTKKKIQDPNDNTDPKDPAAAVIEVPVRDQLVVTQGANAQYQQYTHFFANDASNSSRETHSRRVYHYDVPDDQLDENKNPPRDTQDYLNALGDKDSSQYLEVEILDAFTTNENENRDSHGRLKPSAWQEKRWLVANASDVLLRDRDGDISNDSAIKNPADGIIDPPWRLDPLQNIVNVGMDPYKLVLFRQGLHGDPQSVIAFTTPKTFFTGSEKLPAPAFGANIDVPTDTRSPNRTDTGTPIPGGPPVVLSSTISGDSLLVAEAIGFPDYRGYTTMSVLKWGPGPDADGNIATIDSGEKIYFNYKGEKVDKIPPMTKTALFKGLPLATDQDGTVYVRSSNIYPGGPSNPLAGITKYNKNGDILWTSNTGDPDPLKDSPRSANYDPKTGHITFVLPGAQTAIASIHTWDLDGNEVSVVTLPSGYRTTDVTKSCNKIYALNDGDGTMAAFSPSGSKIWEITAQTNSAVAFGEDWVISIEFVNVVSTSDEHSVPGPGDLNVTTTITGTNSFDSRMSIYNADNGSKAGSEFWSKNSSDSVHTFDANFNFDNVEINISSYGGLQFFRSDYFP
jgi:hypothetical protein